MYYYMAKSQIALSAYYSREHYKLDRIMPIWITMTQLESVLERALLLAIALESILNEQKCLIQLCQCPSSAVLGLFI